MIQNHSNHLNPFNHSVLSDYELHHDCLCYLTYNGNPVKASRLFAGYEHEQQVKRLAVHFNKPVEYYTGVKYDTSISLGHNTNANAANSLQLCVDAPGGIHRT